MGIITSETKQEITKNIATKELETDSKVVEPSEHPFADALTGNDPPMEFAHPGLQPALVFLSYPLALVVIVSVVGMYFLFTQRDGRQGEVTAPATQSPITDLPSDKSAKIQAP